ncbi:helix-turn-helix transcriptional regulator [Baia soyae]|uniref:Helix-turn-helix protein n=1 Tax=Baia soyae TaxID=1544746 RepID=A0A4R2SCF2_9BACL|nr:helix-turn-helix transcriptional regulator [Baia soyae]TCP70586.1 helix-turn-helix protein [Baia soyae]
MIFQLEDDTIRYVLRRRRIKELGKSMGDLEDHLISRSTISNIESGKGKISSRTIEIYLEKLEITEDQVVAQSLESKAEVMEYYDQLEAIEHIINRGDPSTATELLERFQFDEYFPLTPYYLSIQGRICYEEHDYKRAEKKYLHALELCMNKYKHNPSDNIIAICYKELARCSYETNDLNQALVYVDLGLDSYDETKEKKEIKYILSGNKVMYLLKSSQQEQASRLLDQVWAEVESLDSRFDGTALINLYKHRAMVLRDSKMYEEAHQCCKQGMQITRNRSDGRIGHYLDFLIISGSIYLQQKELTKAFDRFQLALGSDASFRSPRRHVDIHTYLGVLFNSTKDWEQSLYHLEKAIQIEKENPDPYRLSKTLIVRGNVHFFQNQFSEALVYYQESAIIAEKYGYKQRAYTSLWKLTDCFDKLGDVKQKHDCLDKMYRLQKELHIRSEVIICEA